MARFIILVAAGFLLSGCKRPVEGPIYGSWTPVEVQDCSAGGIIVTIQPDVYGITIDGHTIPLGRVVAVDISQPGLVDLEYNMVVPAAPGREAAFLRDTTHERFRILGPNRIQGVDILHHGERGYRPHSETMRENLDLQRC